MYERPLIREMCATDLTLSKTNPRFPKPVNSEEEAILTFFKLKKVGPKKIEAIIQDIIETGVVLQDFIVLHTDNEYIVHDGNRRLTALKLLLDDTAELIKDMYPRTYHFIEKVKQNIDVKTLILYAKVYSDPEAMANHVIKIHSGEQLGAGQITWDSNEKDTFAAQFFNKPLNIGNLIYKKLELTSNKKHLYEKIKDNGYATTFERIFNFSDIRTRIFKLDRGIKVDLDKDEHFNKVCEMIEYFISQDATVVDVYTKDMASNFFAKISPISSDRDTTTDEGPSSESETDSNLESTNGGSNSGTATTEGSDTDTDSVDSAESDNQPYSLNLRLKANKKVITLYNDFDLTELIEVATDSNGENLEEKLHFNSESNFIKDNIFSGNAPIGTYTIQVKLENNGISVSRSVEINVVLSRKTIKTDQPKNEFFKSLAAFADGEVKININSTVNMLISEIQSLKNAQDYRYMIASSVRQLLELSIDKVIKDKSLRNHGNPKQNLKFLIEHLTDRTLLNQICNGDNKLRYQATKNFLGAIESDKLYDYLNLITHDSYATDYAELVERVNKSVTPILVVFHNYLQLD
ncbi:ParB N-terminal domain-containing protein [Paenibacillus alvei]|uniref:ParB N-terminal domain-containing protein n=1 Tax=Paenibacillus alvei TaxID=44250 RepID=UPI0013DCEAFF|nr:ParB N-terminal domain-containing protein [Paenibacillus alvei]NEZ40735.1 hypothetical protein [Paenibacillus alvei]